MKLGILGLGKMGEAILSGIQQQHLVSPSNLYYMDPVKEVSGIHRMKDEKSLYEAVDVIILAIKPQVFPKVIPLLQASVHTPFIISIAGGIDLSYLNDHFPTQKIIRVMPNLAAAIGKSVSVYSINKYITTQDKVFVTKLFSAIGTIHPIEEQLMDGVVALNGSFPAYLYAFLEAMIEAAVADGFNEEYAKELILETTLASTHLAMQDERNLSTLIRDICSPQGITLEGIKVMEDENIKELVRKVYVASRDRSRAICESTK